MGVHEIGGHCLLHDTRQQTDRLIVCTELPPALPTHGQFGLMDGQSTIRFDGNSIRPSFRQFGLIITEVVDLHEFLDAQQPSSSGKEAGLISYTNPGPSTSQENLLVESEDLIFVKEEPYVSDNEQEHYETAFVDFSATESYRHDELSGSSYGGAPIPETYYGVETESNVEPSDAQQSGHVIEKAVSLAAGQAHDSKRSSTQRSTQQDNARSCDEKEQDKTSNPTEASGNYTKSRFRVMELTLEQLKKEHKAKMKEHEASMREHEKRMSDQEKITEMQLDIMKKEHEMKITEIEFRYQDLKKKSDWDGKVHKLTIMNLQQKLSTCQLEHQEKSKLHEFVVQELQQKLTNSQLEHRILLKKLKELGE
uniref:Uncharacterized protein n=1 Tax=Timema bartmani TaxID=61472 RepID=A0A7R9HW25_9NEOP|nr:unnamed protein product [Timema bartmani]